MSETAIKHGILLDKQGKQRNGWVVLFALLFCGIVVIMNQYKVPPFLALLLDPSSGMGFESIGGAGWVMSLDALMGIIIAFPAAFLLHSKLGPKRAGMIGLACSVFGVALGATATFGAQLLISRIIEGAGVALMGVVATTIISMYFPREKAGLPMGIWNLWYTVGATLGLVVAWPFVNAVTGALAPLMGTETTGLLGFILDMVGQGGSPSYWQTPFWRAWWWLGDALAIIAFILFTIFVHEPAGYRAGLANQATSANKAAKTSILSGFKVGRMWILGFAFMFLMFTSLACLTQIHTYLVQAHGFDETAAGNFATLGFAWAIPMSIINGFILKKFTKAKQRSLMLVICGILVFVYVFAFLIPADLLPYYMVLLGFESGYTAGVVWAMVPLTMPKAVTMPIGMAIITFCQGLANLFCTPIVGYVVDHALPVAVNEASQAQLAVAWQYAAIPIVISATCGLILTIVYHRTKPAVFEEDEAKAAAKGGAAAKHA